MLHSPSASSSMNKSSIVEEKERCAYVKTEFHKKEKISLLGSSLYSLAEAIGRAVIGSFAWAGHFISLCCWQQAKSFGIMQIEKAGQAGSKAFRSFYSIFYSKNPNETSKTEKHTSDQSSQGSAQIKTKILQRKPDEKTSQLAPSQTHFVKKEQVQEPRKTTPSQTSHFPKQPDKASEHAFAPPQTPSSYDLYFVPNLFPVFTPTSGFPQVSGNKQNSIAKVDDLMPSQGSSSGSQQIGEAPVFSSFCEVIDEESKETPSEVSFSFDLGSPQASGNTEDPIITADDLILSQGSSSGSQQIKEAPVFHSSFSEASHEERKKERQEILSAFSLAVSFASPQISGKEEDFSIPADDLMPPQGSSSRPQEIEETPVFNSSVSPQVHEETKEEQKQEIQKFCFEPPVLNSDDPMRFEWTIHDASKIPDKLKTQLERAQAQANREIDKAFKWLPAPADFKAKTFSQEIGGYSVGDCSFIGKRPKMEDESLATQFNLNIQGTSYPVQLFGIFDGHGGRAASRYVKENIQRVLHETLLQFGSNGLTEDAIWNALKITKTKLHDEFKEEKSGTTANVAMFLDDKIYISNVADSRAILDDGRQLSEDQKLNDEYYIRGIQKRGNIVYFGRFNGLLAVPRAIGDRDVRIEEKTRISARPKITAIANPKEGHLILGCDGIYDVASTRQVAESVREHADQSAAELARAIVYSAYKADSKDNLSVLVIKLSQKKDS